MTGSELIAQERMRQTLSGRDAHDKEYGALQLQDAAAAYLFRAAAHRMKEINRPQKAATYQRCAALDWPFLDDGPLETTSRKEALIKAGAMIAAQLDQIIAKEVLA